MSHLSINVVMVAPTRAATSHQMFAEHHRFSQYDIFTKTPAGR
jgi:hypothetical protein